MSQAISLSSCEQAIKQLTSVAAARIKANAEGEIEEIHVLAGPGRNPKQVVRDIEAVLEAQFGLQVDHKKISVAQIGEEEDEPAAAPEAVRPKLVGVTLRTVNARAEAKVELLAGEKLLEASTQGPASSYNKLRLFVDATLKCLEMLTLEGCMFVVEDVALTQLAKRQVALVTVSLVTGAGEEQLAGCALVKHDDREAIVKATLDAVNRKLKFIRDV